MEQVINRMRGIKAMLCYISEVSGQIEDSEYLYLILISELGKCIAELEEL